MARPPTTGRTAPSKPKPSSLKTQYLILYNLVSALLWLVVLARVVFLVLLTGPGTTYDGIGQFAKWTQTIAVLEIVHAAAGKCKSGSGQAEIGRAHV